MTLRVRVPLSTILVKKFLRKFMKKLVVITSVIKPTSDPIMFYETRSRFGWEERLRQTVASVVSIKNLLGSDTDIVIVDASLDENFSDEFNWFQNVKYYALSDLNREGTILALTNANKSIGELTILNSYYECFYKEIQQYDIVFKLSGRYFPFNVDLNALGQDYRDKIFFKYPQRFEWQPEWDTRFALIDQRKIENNNVFSQYCTMFYAFGINNLQLMIELNTKMKAAMQTPEMYDLDVEMLSYFYTRPYKDVVVETDWKVCGWLAPFAKQITF
jgi:hypothetical protein